MKKNCYKLKLLFFAYEWNQMSFRVIFFYQSSVEIVNFKSVTRNQSKNDKGVSFSRFDRIFLRFYVINRIKRYKTYHGDILNFMKINNTFSVRSLFSKYFSEHTEKTSVFR